jgi:hypothetical protein
MSSGYKAGFLKNRPRGGAAGCRSDNIAWEPMPLQTNLPIIPHVAVGASQGLTLVHCSA